MGILKALGGHFQKIQKFFNKNKNQGNSPPGGFKASWTEIRERKISSMNDWGSTSRFFENFKIAVLSRNYLHKGTQVPEIWLWAWNRSDVPLSNFKTKRRSWNYRENRLVNPQSFIGEILDVQICVREASKPPRDWFWVIFISIEKILDFLTSVFYSLKETQ